MRRITFLLIIFLIVGCGNRGCSKSTGCSKILSRTGSSVHHKIHVSPGVRPRISWAGGDAGSVEVQYWDDAREKWEKMWSIRSLGSFWTGRDENTFISPPITYGVARSDYYNGVTDSEWQQYLLLTGISYDSEDLVPGEEYRISVLGPLRLSEVPKSIGKPLSENFWFSNLRFIR